MCILVTINPGFVVIRIACGHRLPFVTITPQALLSRRGRQAKPWLHLVLCSARQVGTLICEVNIEYHDEGEHILALEQAL